MNYLDFFHFDNHPFVSDENVNYFFPKKSFLKIISEITELCRFKAGIFIIKGNAGVGKTIILKKILDNVSNNDFTLFIKSEEKTDILKIIANKLGADSKNINDVLSKLSNIYTKGKNVIIAVDDVEKLSKEEYINLYSLIQVLPNLKIILCGKKGLYKQLHQKALQNIKSYIVKKVKIQHFSIFTAMKYISYMEKNALALSQYKKVFSWFSVLTIAVLTNVNIKNTNFIAEQSLLNAFNNKKNKVGVKDVLIVVRKNLDLVKYNVYHKFQKAFFYMLLIFSLYYVGKIILDRQELINHIEAQKSVREQEKEIRNT